jgi:hypothetical protein
VRSVPVVLVVLAVGCATEGAEVDPEPSVTSVTSVTAPRTDGDWWRPTPERPLTLHWVLDGPLDVSDPSTLTADVYDIDPDLNPRSTVDLLHQLGKRVICYIDAGVFEDYRDDADRFPRDVIGAPDIGWPGSYWLDIRRIDVLRPIMQDRIARCAEMGFDAVEPDEMVNYSNESGFDLTYDDQLAYNQAFASWVHDVGLSVGLKGDIEQARDLQPHFDWTLNEDCYLYDECTDYDGGLTNFSDAGKAVWVAEYPETWPDGRLDWEAIVADARSRRWNVALYELGLPVDGEIVHADVTW